MIKNYNNIETDDLNFESDINNNIFVKNIKNVIKHNQNLLIKELNNLPVELRSQLFTRFNKLKYKLLDRDLLKDKVAMTTLGFYSQSDSSITILSSAMFDYQVTILHEMIHAITDISDKKKDIKQDGYAKIVFNKINNVTIAIQHTALTEAATQYYAIKFLNSQENYGYEYLVNIYSYLSDVCGYDKLMKSFFACDLDGFKSIVQETFHLKDKTLIDRLIMEMEAINNVDILNDAEGLKKFQLYNHCYITLQQMNFYKLKFENPEFSDQKIKELIDLNKLTKCLDANVNLADSVYVLKKFLRDGNLAYNLNGDNSFEYDKFDMQNCKIISKLILNKKITADESSLIKQNIYDFLLFANSCKYCATDQKIYYAKDVFKKIIDAIKNKDGKLDLSNYTTFEKNKIINLILTGSASVDKDNIFNLQFEDIFDFVNNNYSNILFINKTSLLKKIIQNIEYIKPNIKQGNNFIKALQKKFNKVEENQM